MQLACHLRLQIAATMNVTRRSVPNAGLVLVFEVGLVTAGSVCWPAPA
jgi:hypothetical protein